MYTKMVPAHAFPTVYKECAGLYDDFMFRSELLTIFSGVSVYSVYVNSVLYALLFKKCAC